MNKTYVYLDVDFFTCEKDRIKEGLRNRGITADDVINIETICENMRVYQKVWYRSDMTIDMTNKETQRESEEK